MLLTSGTTVTWAHHALLEGDRKGLKYGLILTVVLGACFTCVQAYEYAHAAFHFSGNIYGATFFMATGFHGFHVLVGTIFLLVCLIRAYAGHFTPTQHLGFEFAAWYWHFVDVVWLFLFICIYVWFRGPEGLARRALIAARATKGRSRPPLASHRAPKGARARGPPYVFCSRRPGPLSLCALIASDKDEPMPDDGPDDCPPSPRARCAASPAAARAAARASCMRASCSCGRTARPAGSTTPSSMPATARRSS